MNTLTTTPTMSTLETFAARTSADAADFAAAAVTAHVRSMQAHAHSLYTARVAASAKQEAEDEEKAAVFWQAEADKARAQADAAAKKLKTYRATL